MSENQGNTDLSQFDNSWYHPGKNRLVRALWFCTQGVFFSSWLPGSGWRRTVLRLFGGNIGKSVVIKPSVIIKYPWKLKIGDYSWIGEKVWIDNLDMVDIGSNCCLSQGAFLLCGNHNYKKTSFDLIIRPIVLENGVWIGAKATVVPGITCAQHSVLNAGSVATSNLDAYGIYSGNPAVKVRQRLING